MPRLKRRQSRCERSYLYCSWKGSANERNINSFQTRYSAPTGHVQSSLRTFSARLLKKVLLSSFFFLLQRFSSHTLGKVILVNSSNSCKSIQKVRGIYDTSYLFEKAEFCSFHQKDFVRHSWPRLQRRINLLYKYKCCFFNRTMIGSRCLSFLAITSKTR